ncbi:MAG: methyltransferase domain-containing protein [Pedobacter sp.]|nr:MAG: methyltransferase domain-containing protein [Pedobacter sp.]
MPVNTKYRSNDHEIMDDFSLDGDLLRDALDKIASINRFLGGNKVTIEGLERLIRKKEITATITILDVGCGNGDMLRALADYATATGRKFRLIGLDANPNTIAHAQNLTKSYSNISFICDDIFNELKQERYYDVILCTLTLHHFKDDEILGLVNGFRKQAIMGIVINDLHRSRLAYYLFIGVCFIFRLNSMSKQDGLVSILRGFKMDDIMHYADRLDIDTHFLSWKWAFRYQWVIPSA